MGKVQGGNTYEGIRYEKKRKFALGVSSAVNSAKAKLMEDDHVERVVTADVLPLPPRLLCAIIQP